jgi:hypothetical protein
MFEINNMILSSLQAAIASEESAGNMHDLLASETAVRGFRPGSITSPKGAL